MSREFTFDLLEQKKDLLYAAGSSLTELAVGDDFVMLYRDGSSARQRKVAGAVDLTIAALLVNGEPVDDVQAGVSVLVALSGDSTRVYEEAEALGWRRKSGRLLRTSETALTLSDEVAS